MTNIWLEIKTLSLCITLDDGTLILVDNETAGETEQRLARLLGTADPTPIYRAARERARRRLIG